MRPSLGPAYRAWQILRRSEVFFGNDTFHAAADIKASSSFFGFDGGFQHLRRLDFQNGGQFADDFQAGIEHAFFQLAQIAAADFGFVGQVVL